MKATSTQPTLDWDGLSSTVKPALEELHGHVVTFLARLPLVLVAIGVLLVAWLVSRWLRRKRSLFVRFSENQFIQDLARTTAALLVLALGFLVSLELLDATSFVAALLGTAGVLGIAIGFAFRDLAENFIASILLALRQPFAPNDHVEVDGDEGRIVRLTSRATILMTLDGNHLRIPNAAVFKARILNFTRNPTRRFRIEVGVDTGADLVVAKQAGLDALREHPSVLDDPGPTALVDTLGDSTVQMAYFGWVDQTQFDFQKVRGDAIRELMNALERADVEMPEPIYRLRIEDLRAGALPPSRGEAATQRSAAGILDTLEPGEIRGAATRGAADRTEVAPSGGIPSGGRGVEENDLGARDELAGAVARELEDGEQNLLSSHAPVE